MDMDSNKADPYVVLRLGMEEHRTRYKDDAGGTLVVFNEVLSFSKRLQDNLLRVQVLDRWPRNIPKKKLQFFQKKIISLTCEFCLTGAQTRIISWEKVTSTLPNTSSRPGGRARRRCRLKCCSRASLRGR